MGYPCPSPVFSRGGGGQRGPTTGITPVFAQSIELISFEIVELRGRDGHQLYLPIYGESKGPLRRLKRELKIAIRPNR